MTGDGQPPPSRTWIERMLSPVAEAHREEVSRVRRVQLVHSWRSRRSGLPQACYLRIYELRTTNYELFLTTQ